MNTETGTIYRTQHEIEAAEARGERLKYFDKETAQRVDEAINRHERRKQAKLVRQAAKQARRKL